jgi:hypothetical protein
MRLTEVFDNIINETEERWNSLDKGQPLFIPLPDELGRLKKIIPGFIKKENWLITAQTGVGKSKLTRYLFIKYPIEYCKQNPNIKVHIIYNTLEESTEEVIGGFIIEYILDKYGIELDYYHVFGFRKVNSTIRSYIKEARQKIAELEPYLEVTNISNPTGLYKLGREYARKYGDFFDVDGNKLTDEELDSGKRKWVSYKSKPNHFTFLINDRLLLLNTETKNGRLMTQYENLDNWMGYYCRQLLNNKFDIITINIQQQIPSGEQKQYTSKGESITEKLEPSLDKLNQVKGTQQHCTIALAIFDPARYGIQDRFGYSMVKLRDSYRELILLKHRKGITSRVFPTLFDGAAETFTDLPNPNTKELFNLYNQIASKSEKKNLVKIEGTELSLQLEFDYIDQADNIKIISTEEY